MINLGQECNQALCGKLWCLTGVETPVSTTQVLSFDNLITPVEVNSAVLTQAVGVVLSASTV